ncbi:MAG: M23 family metallopeptidase [Pseudomonadota bacterium]|nr:M23 family metallopeptidase [Pseudomonadota bacterium]QKK06455.1 MAG: M23 family metallopeptidase [Pseudomonadota bacterium]
MRVTSFPKFRLRYVVFGFATLAALLVLAGEPQQDALTGTDKVFDIHQISAAAAPVSADQEDAAAQMSMIAPAAGNASGPIDLTDMLVPLKNKLFAESDNNAPVNAVRLTAEETALPVAAVLTPSKKPFLKVEEAVIKGGLTAKKITISSGDTLGSILNDKGGLTATQTYDICLAVKDVYDPARDMKAGQKLALYFDGGDFKGMEIRKNLIDGVKLVALDDGRYGVKETAVPTQNVYFSARGDIDSSLYKAATDQGMPDSAILEMIRIYSWAVDFQRDIRPGDNFEAMYKLSMTKDGKAVPGSAEIVYANLNLRGADTAVYRFTDSEGDIGYYEETGKSIRKALMRTPIDGARLSSGFGMRKHPVLGYSKMHRGLDFAAPTGTPIYAAGDGRIAYLGTKGGYGKFIKIRHHAGLETAYAHMSRYKKGLTSGARVKQGEIIGYVGTTGRSTGPHLHYEVVVNGHQADPRKVKMQEGKKLAGKDLEIFHGVVNQTRAQYVSLLKKSATRHASLNNTRSN